MASNYGDDDPAEGVFSNSLITSRISRYLGIADLKSFLGLNRSCHESSIKLFRKRTLVHFETHEDVQKYTEYFSRSENVPTHIHTEFRIHSSLNMSAKPSTSNDEDRRVSRRLQNISLGVISLHRFFDRFGPQIKFLKGSFTWTKEDFQRLENTVLNRLENVEELQLHIFLQPNFYTQEENQSASSPMESVRKLSLWLALADSPYAGGQTSNFSKVGDIADRLVLRFPNLQSLHLPPTVKGVTDDVHARLAERILCQGAPGHPYLLSKHLRELAIPFSTYIGFMLNTTLYKMPLGLERLELFDTFHWSQEMNECINKTLENYSSTLQVLKMPINLVRGHLDLINKENNTIQVPLDFPRLPKLKVLELEFLIRRNYQVLPVPQLQFVQKSGEKYSEIFPDLESLRIHVRTSVGAAPWVEAINNRFIPTDLSKGVAPSVRHVEIVNHFGSADDENEKDGGSDDESDEDYECEETDEDDSEENDDSDEDESPEEGNKEDNGRKNEEENDEIKKEDGNEDDKNKENTDGSKEDDESAEGTKALLGLIAKTFPNVKRTVLKPRDVFDDVGIYRGDL